MEGSWSPFEVLGLSQAQLLSAIMKLIRVVAPHFVARFKTDGQTWTRSASYASSNPGKTKYWTIIYRSASGRVFMGGSGATRPLNRRNDRESGLGTTGIGVQCSSLKISRSRS